MSRHILHTWALCGALLSTACLDVGDQRAEADLTVGRAETDALNITVDRGAAQVRNITDEALTLWASTPQATVRLTSTRDGMVTLTAQNIMASTTTTIDGVALQETDASRPVPTEGVWRVPVTAGDETVIELAAPEPAAAERWEFVAFADVQDDIDRVQDLYGPMRENPEIRFGLISGDLTEEGSPAQLERFQREMRTLPFPCYATLGNHELGTSETLFHEYFGRGNHHFAWGGAHFTLLDSASATIAAPVWEWLDEWLAQGAEAPHMVMMHIPVLDENGLRNGAFASRAEANRLIGRFAQGGVDLAVYGHVHTYSAYSTAGIPTYISGGGGAIPMRLDGIGRHFLNVEVDPARQTFDVGVVRVTPEE